MEAVQRAWSAAVGGGGGSRRGGNRRTWGRNEEGAGEDTGLDSRKGGFRLSRRCARNVPQFASLSAAAAQASTAAPSYEDSDPEGTPSASTTGIIGETVVIIASDGDSGLTKVTLITGDRNGLMADVGSAFSSLGMSVQYAEMKSGSDGFVENSFVVSGPDCGPIPAAGWENLKSRLKASCSKRGRGRPWQERESRLRELFSRIDTMETGFIAQEDLDMFAQSLRMPRAFVHDFVDEVGLYKLSSVDP